jgi:hypothetical protein
MKEERESKMTEEIRENDVLEFEQPLEEEVEKIEIPSSERVIFAEKADPEVESLYGKYKRGILILQPDFQRQFIWDNKKASKLIESALLDIPLPVVYLSEEKDGKVYVIDGQQRLTAFFSFIDGKFPDGRDFRLTGLKVFDELNTKFFREISEALQDKIRFCNIRTVTFRKESKTNLKFEIFERLNTGAVSLNDQELRNCIYRGPYNNLLKELAQDRDFVYLLGLKKPEKRMKDIELVLRFAAFYHSTYLNYKPPMSSFLSKDMEKNQFISGSEVAELKTAFKNSVSIVKSLLSTHAFKRFYKGDSKNPNGYWESQRFNASLYDISMYSFAKQDKNKVYQNLDSIREGLIFLMTNDQEFIDSIELSTSSTQAIVKRFDKWRMELESIIGIGQRESRCFSLQLKSELFKNNATCAICGQKIHDIDDAAIDHIEQYWLGGKTIPENARLTHRFCNNSRPRLDIIEDGRLDGAVQKIKINSPRGEHVRLPHGERTPQREYRMSILKVIIDLGGSGKVQDILNNLEITMHNILKPIDYDKLSSGEIRYRNTAMFERNAMVKEGLLSADSRHGYWEITDKGRKYVK